MKVRRSQKPLLHGVAIGSGVDSDCDKAGPIFYTEIESSRKYLFLKAIENKNYVNRDNIDVFVDENGIIWAHDAVDTNPRVFNPGIYVWVPYVVHQDNVSTGDPNIRVRWLSYYVDQNFKFFSFPVVFDLDLFTEG